MEARRAAAFVCLLTMMSGVAWQQEIGLPSFTTLPPQLVEFSNMTGTRIPCSANNHPFPANVSWLGADGLPLKPISGLREILPDGTLVLPPFKAENFRQDVHSTFYKCAITNTLGTIVSNDIAVKAVVLQPYDVYVYDVFAMSGSTAILKCHVPKVISKYVTVTSWIKDATKTVSASGLSQDSRFNVIPSGELFVKDVIASDAKSTFDCVATNKLTGEAKKSVSSGKLFVTEPQGNVPPKITFSKKTISANVGKVVLLPCEAQAYPVPNIRWSRSSETSDDTDLSTKDSYSLVSGSLLIKNVQISHSGTYICTASNVAGSVQMEVQLVINEPLLVTIHPSRLIVDSGHHAKLSCKVIGSPVTAVTWLKDGQPLALLPGVEMQSNVSVHISSISPEHKGIYQCMAKTHSEGAFGTAVLTLGDSSPVFMTGFKDLTLQPGASATLHCTFSGSPTPEVTWFLDSDVVPSNAIQTQSVTPDDSIDSTLTIDHLKREDGGMYSCRASNKAGKISHNSRVNVYGKLESRRRVKITAVSGQTVVLNCPFVGYPFTNIKWEKDTRSLPQNLRQQLTENDNLMIRGVNRISDSGIYTCSVSQESRTIQSQVELLVMVPPKLAPFSFQDELVREGMRGRIQCVVLEGDLPITLNWLKDDRPIPSTLGVTIREIDEFSSILTIPFISPRHNGNYTCLAKNPAAEVTFTTSLSVNGNPLFGYCFSSSSDPAICFPR